MSKQEIDQLDYEDALVSINSIFEQYGVRQAMMDFRDAYPKMFEELVTQINRVHHPAQIAALLRP